MMPNLHTSIASVASRSAASAWKRTEYAGGVTSNSSRIRTSVG